MIKRTVRGARAREKELLYVEGKHACDLPISSEHEHENELIQN